MADLGSVQCVRAGGAGRFPGEHPVTPTHPDIARYWRERSRWSGEAAYWRALRVWSADHTYVSIADTFPPSATYPTGVVSREH